VPLVLCAGLQCHSDCLSLGGPRPSHMLRKYSTTKLHPSTIVLFLDTVLFSGLNVAPRTWLFLSDLALAGEE
jgi:hypothetical protein